MSIYSVIGKIKRNDELNEELEKQKEFSCEMLKLMIGRPIYWASPHWRHETHIITDVRYEIFDSDFLTQKRQNIKVRNVLLLKLKILADILQLILEEHCSLMKKKQFNIQNMVFKKKNNYIKEK